MCVTPSPDNPGSLVAPLIDSTAHSGFFHSCPFLHAGFGVYSFLFNLYLLDFYLNECVIGLVNRALFCAALWTGLFIECSPFATMYFAQLRHESPSQLRLIFSASQVAQPAGGLVFPMLERNCGLTKSVAISQESAGMPLMLKAVSYHARWARQFLLQPFDDSGDLFTCEIYAVDNQR